MIFVCKKNANDTSFGKQETNDILWKKKNDDDFSLQHILSDGVITWVMVYVMVKVMACHLANIFQIPRIDIKQRNG